MQRSRHSAFFLALTLLFGLHSSLAACPLCKDAISSPGTEGEEINNAPTAYNASIYLMAGMPYLLLGSVGFLIYRGCQKNAVSRQEGPAPAAPGPESDGLDGAFSEKRISQQAN